MFLSSLNIPGSGLTAEQYRLNLIAQNITHAETTRRADGKPGPYRRKTPLYQEIDEPQSFAEQLGRQIAGMRGERRGSAVYTRPGFRSGVTSGEYLRRHTQRAQPQENYNGGVRIKKVIEDPTPGKLVYDPEHPDANEEGYVEMPNVEMLNEMVNMMGASRAYEANVQVVNAMKAMAMKALELGR